MTHNAFENGGVVGKTITPNSTTAPGIWSINAVQRARLDGNFPIPSYGVDSYVVAMLHGNGTDGSTTITDQIGKTWTAGGNAQIDTAQSKFGGASILFDGTGDYVQSADNADWNLGTGDFSFDFQMRINSLPGSGSYQYILSHHNSGSPETGAYEVTLSNFSGTYYLDFWYYTSSWQNISKTFSPSTGVWYHVELTKNGSNFYIFVDGTQIGTTGTLSNTLTKATSTPFTVGTRSDASGGFNGWLDEIRISKGIARHTANFTAPIIEYS